MLLAFDHLFDRAADKLQIRCSADEKAAAKESFERRFAGALKVAEDIFLDEIPAEAMHSMEHTIDDLSPAQVVGHLASIPLIQQAQQMIQTLTWQAAQQKLLDHLIDQADDTYGGN